MKQRSLILVVAAIALTLATPGIASAGVCDGDAWADFNSWGDNYWVGWDNNNTCDLNGRYTVGIQQINWDEGYRQSGVDGFYGNNTHQDVRSFQAFYNLGVDGLVGTNTWNKYRNRVKFSHENGSFDVYETKAAGTEFIAKDVVSNKWWILRPPWEKFDKWGPN